MGARHSVTEYTLVEMIQKYIILRHSRTEYALAEMILNKSGCGILLQNMLLLK
jgi:hypothetical protein